MTYGYPIISIVSDTWPTAIL